MRLIGHIPSEAAANTFGCFLSSQGIGNVTEAVHEGWEVWVHSEDQWRKARELLVEFLANPAAPRYSVPVVPAPGTAIPNAPSDPGSVMRPRETSGTVSMTLVRHYRVGALTLVFVGLCLVVQVLREAGFNDGVLRELFMTEITFDGDSFHWHRGLKEIEQGEFWRLLTPVMVHGSWLHLLMNMFWLIDLGSRIESRQGTGRLGLLVVTIGVLSNIGQYLFFDANFCGMSGVIYGLLAYVWVKGRLDPASLLSLQTNTVVMLLVWFFVCLAGIIPNVANGAHAIGLVAGAAWGVLLSLPALRRRAAR